jgi:hypothetical protein
MTQHSKEISQNNAQQQGIHDGKMQIFGQILFICIYIFRVVLLHIYGSILAPFSYNRAASVGCHGRQLRPIFADWLCQLPTLPPLLFTCQLNYQIPFF